MKVAVSQVVPYTTFRTPLTRALGVRLPGETDNGVPVLIAGRGRREVREDLVVEIASREQEDESTGAAWVFQQEISVRYGLPVNRRRKARVPLAGDTQEALSGDDPGSVEDSAE